MISTALKLIRTYHGFKQKDLAKLLDISASHLSEIEKGDKPVSYELLEKYSNVFRMPISSITLFAEAAGRDGALGFSAIVTRKALKLLEWVDSISEIKKIDDLKHAKSH